MECEESMAPYSAPLHMDKVGPSEDNQLAFIEAELSKRDTSS